MSSCLYSCYRPWVLIVMVLHIVRRPTLAQLDQKLLARPSLLHNTYIMKTPTNNVVVFVLSDCKYNNYLMYLHFAEKSQQTYFFLQDHHYFLTKHNKLHFIYLHFISYFFKESTIKIVHLVGLK